VTAPSLPLFEWVPPKATPSASEQSRQAARVGRGIDEAVIAVARGLVGAGPFVLESFTAQVRSRRTCAPDSARRRLSALVDTGFIQARCVDRSRSLWVIEGVAP
jgi:hypothetical protein